MYWLSAQVRNGADALILSDLSVDLNAHTLYVPPLLAAGAVHHALIAEGLRMKTSLVKSGNRKDAFEVNASVPYFFILILIFIRAQNECDICRECFLCFCRHFTMLDS